MPTKPAPSTEPKPKKTRVMSPEKLALREKFKLESAAIDKAKASAKTLLHITEKLLPKLTADDSAKLWSALGALQKS